MSGTFNRLRRTLAAQRLKPGDRRPLKRFRWWQLLGRALFYLRLTAADGRQSVYAVDVRHAGSATTGEVEAHLYLDGVQEAVSVRMPAAFPVPGGRIEVSASTFGLKRCHYVTADGHEQQLVPDGASAEGRRADFDRTHPRASRWIGAIAMVVLVIGLAILIPQLISTLSEIPPISQNIGTFTSPIQLSVWGNTLVSALTIAASTERALRLRFNWLLDGGAG